MADPHRKLNPDLPAHLVKLPDNTILKPEDWPSRLEIQKFFSNVMWEDGTLTPTGMIRFPRSIPHTIDHNLLNDPRSLQITVGDLRYITGDISEAARKMCFLFYVQYMRAVQCAAPLQFRQKWSIVTVNFKDPSNMSHGKVANLQLNYDGKIISCSPHSTRPIVSRSGAMFMPYVFAIHSNRTCVCTAMIDNNNVPSLAFSLICKPHSLLIPYSENDALPQLSHMPNEFRSYKNYNNVYFCPQSNDGTVNLHLLQRHGVATLERMVPKEFSPPYSNIDLIKNPDVGMDVWTMICRPEFKHYTKRMTLHTGKSVQFEVFRFRDIRSLLPYGELESFPDAKSIEDIQINHANAEIFQGAQMCTVCTLSSRWNAP
jgi:hypothetical protein